MRLAPVVAAAVVASSAAAPLPPASRPVPAPIAAPAVFAAPATSSSGSPFALTASDGTGLNLVKMDAKAVVDGPLAFTELVLTFENPQDRTLEGTFRITLPQGSAVSRFAMRIGELWQEGEVIALDLARRVYEDFLHRRQDPALLEQAAGNEFSARVFPIPAKGTKEIVISWSQELAASDARYVLPLAGLPELGALDVSVRRPGLDPVELHKTKYVPSKDFEVEQASKKTLAVREGNHAIVRVTALEGGAAEKVGAAIVLVDTSASRALGFDAQIDLVKKLLAELGGATVTVAAFDQSVEPVYEGKASGAGAAAFKALRDRRALGASDLQGALKWAASKSGHDRVILVTDGVATAGSTDGGELIAGVLALKKSGVQRLDAVAVGGIRDADRLSRLVTAGLPKDGVVADASLLDAKEIAKKLSRATKSDIAVAVEGATWQFPTELDGVQPGDESLIYAEVPAGKPLAVKVGGRRVAIPESAIGSGDPALVERATVRARIGSLLGDLDRKADGPEQKAEIREKIVALSTAHRVLSPFTAMLVLETEEDFERYSLDRKALADVLTIGDKGLVRLKRSDIVLAQAPDEPETTTDAVEKSKDADTGESDDGKNQASVGVGGEEEEGISGSGALGAGGDFAAFEDAGMMDPMMLESPKPSAPSDGNEGLALGLRGSGSGGGGSASGVGYGSGSASVRSATREYSIAAPAPVVAEPPRNDGAPELAREQQRIVTESDVPRVPASRPEPEPEPEPAEDWAGGDGRDPYEGTFAEVMKLLSDRKTKDAVAKARGWREENPGDVMALVAYGTALEAAGERTLAGRAYGSIIDLFPTRADLRRFAGERLERIADDKSLALAADSFEKAAEQRADHPSSHRLLAYARVKRGEHRAAFDGLEKILVKLAEGELDLGRFDGVDRILKEDLALIGAAWSKADPSKKKDVERRLAKLEIEPETKPSLRFVLNWETDANDVDFHILDAKGGHAYYSQRELASGGELYADITSGYGPECFTIRLPKKERAGPYKLKAHYYSRGPMGYGMGKLEILEHDGKGGLTFEQRPFVVMVDEAYVDLGEVGPVAVR